MRPFLSNDFSLRDHFVFDDAGDTATELGETASAAALATAEPAISFDSGASSVTQHGDDGTGFAGRSLQIDIRGGQITLPEATSIALPANPITNEFVFGAALDSFRGDSRISLISDSYVSGDAGGFNIQIDFRGFNWTDDLKQGFIDAAELISDIILGDIADARVRGLGILRSNVVDDVRIDASLSNIDGAGGVLGQAGPTSYRTGSLLPATGVMEFDIADSEDFDAINMFNDIVFHEMLHVLGFGTLWEAMGLVTENGDGTLDFNGTNVATAFAAEFGIGAPSIETEGGSGTAGGHWNEDGDDGYAFENEIMTGYIDVTGNYLSNTTIAALEDMGYDTVFDPSDPLNATSGLDLTIFNDHIA